MKLVFGTTNKRKLKDLETVVKMLNADIDVLSLDDIGWDKGEIEETGLTLQENSLIKAKAIYEFCKEKQLNYIIMADDAGLFVDALGGEPGIYTARYAEAEQKENQNLPKYECVNKLLRNLQGETNRSAKYRCAVTCIFKNGQILQEVAETNGKIANEIMGELKKPYFYSVFIVDGFGKPFCELSDDELVDTYRYQALINMIGNIKEKEINNEFQN